LPIIKPAVIVASTSRTWPLSERRDRERKAALNRIAKEAFESGLYDRTGIPEVAKTNEGRLSRRTGRVCTHPDAAGRYASAHGGSAQALSAALVAAIMDEVTRNLIAKWEMAPRRRASGGRTAPTLSEAWVEGYEPLIEAMTNDPATVMSWPRRSARTPI